MSSIDNRVVQMKFENAGFERGVKTTLASLADLKKGLQLDGAEKGLDKVSEKASRFSLQNISDSVDTLRDRFSVLGAVAFTVIQRMTNAAIDAGKSIVDALVDPLISGGRQRALNIEQAKFQFRGLGMDVEASMESARLAVTGTAYGLDAAARAAGQLGASGLRAGDDMTSALRAISGVAAMTNSSYEDISRIFTTVAGNGRLMGTELLQLGGRGLNAAATLAKALNVTEAEVRDMTSKGQISFEMFYKAMDDAFGENATKANETFTGSLANLRAALSRIGARFFTGYLENMRDIFNALTPVIDDVAKAIGPVVDFMVELSTAASQALVERLGNINLSLAGFVMPPALQGIRNVLEAIGSILKPIGQAFGDIFQGPTLNGLQQAAYSFRDFTAGLKLSEEAANNLRRTFRGVFALFSIGWSIIKGVVGVILDLMGASSGAAGSLLNFTGNIGDFLVSLDDAIKNGGLLEGFFKGLGTVIRIPIEALAFLAGGLSTFAELAGRVASVVGSFLGEAFAGLGSALESASFDSILNVIQVGLLGGIAVMFKRFLSDGFGGFFGNLIGNATGPVAEAIGGLTETLSSMQQQVQVNTIMKIAGAVALLTGSIILLASIDSAKLAKAMTAITVAFAQLLGASAILAKIAGLGGFLKIPFIAASLILLSTALLILSAAVKNLSTLSWEELAKGLVGVTALLVVLSAAAVPLSANAGGLIRASASILVLSVAIRILASAVGAFAELSWGELARGLTALAGSLVVIAGAMLIMPKGIGARAVALVILASAIKILAGALQTMGQSSLKETAKGLGTLAGALVILAAAMAVMPKGMIAQAVALVLVANAIRTISKAVERMGGMSLGEIAKGLGALAGALAILAVGLYAMSGTLAGSASLLVAAGALMMLAPALMMLGNMSIGQIAMGLGALAATFVVLGVAGTVLTPVVPVIFALAAALLLIGIGALAVGGAVALAGIGLAAMASALKMLADTAVDAVATVALVAPQLAVALGQGLVALAAEIGKHGPTITTAFVKIANSLLDAVIQVTPKIGRAMLVLIDTGVKVVINGAPKIARAGFALLMALLREISNNIYRLVTVATTIVVRFARALGDNAPRLADEGAKMIIKFVNGLARAIDNNAADMRAAGRRLAFAIIDGMTGGLASGASRVIRSAANVASSAISSAMSTLGIRSPSRVFMEIGQHIDEGLALGIKNNAKQVDREIVTIADKSVSKMKDSMGRLSDTMRLDGMSDPVIKPVLDLTQFKKDAEQLDIFGRTPIRADVSASRASVIAEDRARTATLETDRVTENKVEINLTQHNTSPETLDDVTIYRNTRSQLATAKEAFDHATKNLPEGS